MNMKEWVEREVLDMGETIKMKGRLLIFDKLDKIGRIFPKDCKISIPEKVPVIWEFIHGAPNMVLGNANVYKDDIGYVIEADITNFDRTLLHDQFEDSFYIGGYYNNVKDRNVNSIRVIDEAKLRFVGVTLGPADDDLKMVVVKKEE